MTDIHDKRTRSYNMSQIRPKDTKPELVVRKFLHSHGFRYRLHDRSLPGKPDLVLKKHNTVVFVHGCFWHAHENCRYFVIPNTREEWWKKKVFGNKKRDEANVQSLKTQGWAVIIIWECQLKPGYHEHTLNRLLEDLRS